MRRELCGSWRTDFVVDHECAFRLAKQFDLTASVRLRHPDHALLAHILSFSQRFHGNDGGRGIGEHNFGSWGQALVIRHCLDALAAQDGVLRKPDPKL